MIGRAEKATAAPAPAEAIAAGTVIEGHRVQRVVAQRAGCFTLVETEARGGARVTLKLFATGEAQVKAGVRRAVNRRGAIAAPLLPVLGSGEHEGRPYLVHAELRGEPLSAVVRERVLAPEEAMRVLGQVAGGLETIAGLGLAHTTLTPKTIFVARRSGQALLTDFGAPGVDGRGCQSACGLDAVDYLAPEEARGAAPQAEGVVYALGCILVECLTGAPPYPYERPLLTLHAHQSEPPPRVSQRVDGLPPALDEVIATALNKQPAQRYASPARLMLAAQRALGVKAPIPVAPTLRAAPEPRPPKPQPAPTAAAEPPRETAPEPRPAPPARPRPRRRRRLIARPAPAAIGLALALAASTAGFAAGNLGGDDRAPAASLPSYERTALAQRARYVQAVDRAVTQLTARRAEARRQLQHARRAGRQAAVAGEVAEAYGTARVALGGKPRPATGGAPVLADRLTAAERAYRRLAAAARRGDARAFRRVRREVVQRERSVEQALRRV